MKPMVAIPDLQAIQRVASRPLVHRAFEWFHLQEPRLRGWHREVARIPAPTFSETARANWMAERLRTIGLSDVHLDDCGNVLGWLRAGDGNSERDRSAILLSAHLDTVFPADAIGEPVEEDNRLEIPGASDNCAGLTALMGTAAALCAYAIQPGTDLLFACNVCEEGEGDLRGMRAIFSDAALAARIGSVVVLDGAGTETIVTEGVGSKRFLLTIAGPGGHSWTDAGIPNPIHVLANALTGISKLEWPASPRTTWNVGRIEGGTAINAIPQKAEARLDTRSTDARVLERMEKAIYREMKIAVDEANREAGTKVPSVQFDIQTIGDRPAAALPNDAPLLRTVRAVDRHLEIQSRASAASTDANIPLALGIPAVSIGGGGSGGGTHTCQEWFDATGRDLALRRILLVLLALAELQS